MACKSCEKYSDITEFDRPYVVRTCGNCGREMKLREPGKHGIGFKVEKGDRVTIPSGFLNIAANPLKGTGQFTSHGLKWFAEMVFGIDIGKPEVRENFTNAVRALMESNEKFFVDAECLTGLDIEDPAEADEVFNRINAKPKSIEWFGYLAAAYCHLALQAIEAGNASEAAWAMAAAERYRALVIFKTNFEEVVFMGHSARRLVDIMRIWDANQENGDEEFWQIKLSEHAYAFSQLFSVPVTMIQGKAYVGGMKLDGKDARFLDLMFSGGSANDAILVEIKTPTTRLLGAKYRKNVFPPSKDIAGAVVQVNEYSHQLRNNLKSLHSGNDLNVFNPRRVIIAGNYGKELTDESKKSSFELFRTSLSDTEIVTYDEFFRKIEHLAKLFNLVRSTAS